MELKTDKNGIFMQHSTACFKKVGMSLIVQKVLVVSWYNVEALSWWQNILPPSVFVVIIFFFYISFYRFGFSFYILCTVFFFFSTNYFKKSSGVSTEALVKRWDPNRSELAAINPTVLQTYDTLAAAESLAHQRPDCHT